MNPLSAIEERFAPLAGRRLLDIGCGRGTLARRLTDRSAEVTGIDPDADAIAAARLAAPAARFEVGDALALPFPDAAFAGAIFLNSLHHLPVGGMAEGLCEAGRVAETVLVLEPLAAGTFFEAFRPIEDETEVRTAAARAIDEVVGAGRLTIASDATFTITERFADFNSFVARVTAAAPERLETVAARRGELEAIFARLATRGPDGRLQLEQPIRAVTLAVAG